MPEAGQEQYPNRDFKQLLRAGVKYREAGNFEAAFHSLNLARDAALDEESGAADKQVAKIFRELGKTYANFLDVRGSELDLETKQQYVNAAIENLLKALDLYSVYEDEKLKQKAEKVGQRAVKLFEDLDEFLKEKESHQDGRIRRVAGMIRQLIPEILKKPHPPILPTDLVRYESQE